MSQSVEAIIGINAFLDISFLRGLGLWKPCVEASGKMLNIILLHFAVLLLEALVNVTVFDGT